MVVAKTYRRLHPSCLYVCRSCSRRHPDLVPSLYRVPTRNVAQKYLRKQEDAKIKWQERAEEIAAGKRPSMLDILESRGYIGQIAGSRNSLNALMTGKRVGAYVGFDPTAPSLHVGHLVPLMVLYWMYIHGLHAVSLLGGATAKYGDPTGRTTARQQQNSTDQKVNMTSMHYQLRKLWMKAELHARDYGYVHEWAWHRELVNNNTWLNKLNVTDLLTLLGRGLRMGPMLGKDTVRSRMESGDGMSFPEFMYPILQSWDWWHMYHTKGVQIQIGGSDQFGNITAGIDAINYINKNHHNPMHQKESPGLLDTPIGFTTPLLTTASGEKFGKSAGNAVWLDKELTSTFDLYQFFVRTADADVERYLKLFTFMPLPDIQTLVSEHQANASKRIAQHKLAYEVLSLVHSASDAQEAARQHNQLFTRNPSLQQLSTSDRSKDSPGTSKPEFISNSLNKMAPITTASNSPSLNITLPTSLVVDQPIGRVLYSAGLVTSRSEGHRLCANEGAYVGSRPANQGTMGDSLEFTPCKNWHPTETTTHIIDGKVLILRVGKWRMKIVHLISDQEFEARGLTAPGWPMEDEAEKPKPEPLPTIVRWQPKDIIRERPPKLRLSLPRHRKDPKLRPSLQRGRIRPKEKREERPSGWDIQERGFNASERELRIRPQKGRSRAGRRSRSKQNHHWKI